MRDAGTVEQRPVGLADAALVAHDKRNHHAGVTPLPQGLQEQVAQVRAGAVDERIELPDPFVQEPGRLLVVAAAHAARGADTLLEHPGLRIEAPGIDRPVRPLQAHGKFPALRWPYGLQRFVATAGAAGSARRRVPR
jgi:hypothetical protein